MMTDERKTHWTPCHSALVTLLVIIPSALTAYPIACLIHDGSTWASRDARPVEHRRPAVQPIHDNLRFPVSGSERHTMDTEDTRMLTRDVQPTDERQAIATVRQLGEPSWDPTAEELTPLPQKGRTQRRGANQRTR